MHCPVCLHQHPLPDGHFRSIYLLRCPDCDHCFTDVSRLTDRVTYDAEYFFTVHKNWFANPDLEQFDLMYRKIAQQGSRRVIDVGCGTGNFLRYLRQKDANLELTGLDLIANDSKDGIEYVQMDFLKESFAGRDFDVVISAHTIEHIDEARDFVQRLQALCRPGGLIIILTPNEHSVLFRAARLMNWLGLKFAFQRLYSEHHVNHYNMSSLPRLCRCLGLEVLETIGTNIPMRLVDTPPVGAAVQAVLRWGVWVTFLLGKLTGATYQQTVICRKPG